MSKKKQTTRQSNNQTLDPWSRSQWTAGRDRVQSMLDTGYQGSWGATEMSGSERQAGDLIQDGLGSWRQGMGDARGMVEGADFTAGTMNPQSFADFDADIYANPHADEMIGQMTGDVEEAAGRARASITSDTLASKAYGGSRHGVREALLDESMLDTIADQSAGIRYDTWNQGADRFYQDVGNDMTAEAYNNDQINQGARFDLDRAGMLADLTGQERAFEGEDIQRLMGYGATERGIEDQVGQRQYNDYLARLQTQMGLLGSTPILVDSTGESTTTTRPGMLDYLNTGANLWSTFTQPGMPKG